MEQTSSLHNHCSFSQNKEKRKKYFPMKNITLLSRGKNNWPFCLFLSKHVFIKHLKTTSCRNIVKIAINVDFLVWGREEHGLA